MFSPCFTHRGGEVPTSAPCPAGPPAAPSLRSCEAARLSNERAPNHLLLGAQGNAPSLAATGTQETLKIKKMNDGKSDPKETPEIRLEEVTRERKPPQVNNRLFKLDARGTLPQADPTGKSCNIDVNELFILS